MKYLITGLGNIGNEYIDTRHNIGFKIIDALAKHLNADLWTYSWKALTCGYGAQGCHFSRAAPPCHDGKAHRFMT